MSASFWSTQPVGVTESKTGELVSANMSFEARTLPPDYSWSTVDVHNHDDLNDLSTFLMQHYTRVGNVKLIYSKELLMYALQHPTKTSVISVAIRYKERLVAFVAVVPVMLRVNSTIAEFGKTSFLCVHSKLRGRRLTPLLMNEVFRRSIQLGLNRGVATSSKHIFQFTTEARYCHRVLNSDLLMRVGFIDVKARRVPSKRLNGRRLQVKDVSQLHRQIEANNDNHRSYKVDEVYDLDQLLHVLTSNTDIVHSYVFERKDGIDVVTLCEIRTSFDDVVVRTARLMNYWYEGDDSRLVAIMSDVLALAHEDGLDMINALSHASSPVFIQQLDFRPGNAHLNYYFYNWNMAKLNGGVTSKGNIKTGHTDISLNLL